MKTPQLKGKVARLEQNLDAVRKQLTHATQEPTTLLLNWLKAEPMSLMQTLFLRKKWWEGVPIPSTTTDSVSSRM